MTEHTITHMFPKVVVKSSDPDAEWHNNDIIEKILKLEMVKNQGNSVSTDNYILNNPEFKNLKEVIQNDLNLVMSKLYEQKNANLYITQSWINISEDYDSHHLHCHPNSILSGVAYLQTIDNDSIYFADHNAHPRIDLMPSSNYNKVRFPVTKGDIILFDSLLFHEVEKVKRKTKRISLAFNTFFKGTIGDPKNLTELRV